jgi:CelD/BcsL family acetyltransferase involved in cellulose biosynthesis
MSTPCRVDELTTLADLEALRAPWQELLRRCPRATPFQAPEWILTWCRRFRCQVIWALAVRGGERLLALAPWLIYRNESGRRVVAFLAGGLSDYHDVLIDPEFTDLAASALSDHLQRRSALWDLCDFEALAPSAAWRAIAPPADWVERESEADECPRLVLDGAGALADLVPSHQLARYRRYRRRLERRATVDCRLAQVGECEVALSELVRLHTARWQAVDPLGTMTAQTATFHVDAAGELARAGYLRLYSLAANRSTIATLYGFVFRRTLYCYLQGIDPQHAEMSPGTILLGMVLEHALGEGIAVVDMLRGSEAYKRAWGARGPRNARKQWMRELDRASAGSGDEPRHAPR